MAANQTLDKYFEELQVSHYQKEASHPSQHVAEFEEEEGFFHSDDEGVDKSFCLPPALPQADAQVQSEKQEGEYTLPLLLRLVRLMIPSKSIV